VLRAAVLLTTAVLVAATGLKSSQSLWQKATTSLKRASAPGPLSRAHGELDRSADCEGCHATTVGLVEAKCLKCHKEIERRQRKRLPFHGLVEGRCWDCHREHRGLEFCSMAFDKKRFDHEQTQFALRGAHRALDCMQCHDAQKAEARAFQREYYLGVPRECVACHADPGARFASTTPRPTSHSRVGTRLLPASTATRASATSSSHWSAKAATPIRIGGSSHSRVRPATARVVSGEVTSSSATTATRPMR